MYVVVTKSVVTVILVTVILTMSAIRELKPAFAVPCCNPDCKKGCLIVINLDDCDHEDMRKGYVLTSVNATVGCVEYVNKGCCCEKDTRGLNMNVSQDVPDPESYGHKLYSRGFGLMIRYSCGYDPQRAHTYVCCGCRRSEDFPVEE